MSATYPPVQSEASHQALESAAEWFALLRSGEATDTDQHQWQTWLAATEDNRTAWLYVERISGRFAPIQQSDESRSAVTAFHTANSRLGRRRRVVFGLVTCIGSSMLGWSLWRHTPAGGMTVAWMADYHTGIGEVRDFALSDGTHVWLGTASAFNQHYENDLRRLELIKGEILIQTAADTARPFVVDTLHGRMRALGTRFTARLDEDTTELAVYQGAVEITVKVTGATTMIRAGEQVRFSSTSTGEVEVADPAREASARGILIAQNMPLEHVIQELRRYHLGHIGIDPAIANLPVFGSYPAQDMERTLNMLSSVMPIQVRRLLPYWISIGPIDSKGTH